MSASKVARLRDVAETARKLARAEREVARLMGVRDARIVRAVEAGATRGEVARECVKAGHEITRQRVQQLAKDVERGSAAGREQDTTPEEVPA